MKWTAMNVFNNPKNSKYTINGFLIVSTFKYKASEFLNGNPLPSSTSISSALALSPTPPLVFSPQGNIYISGECIFYNPMTYDETNLESFDVNWEPILASRYSDYNNQIKTPSYFMSYKSGKWILFNDYETSGNIYILYNPINRPEFEWDVNTYGNYCNRVEFQDAGCYCANFPNQKPRCSYNFLFGETNALAILGQASSNIQNAQSIQNLNNQCGCNQTCKNWLSNNSGEDAASMRQKLDCSVIQNTTLCGVGLSSDTISSLKAAGINIQQYCGGVPDSNVPVSTQGPTTHIDNKLIIGLISVVITFLIIIFIFIIINGRK